MTAAVILEGLYGRMEYDVNQRAMAVAMNATAITRPTIVAVLERRIRNVRRASLVSIRGRIQMTPVLCWMHLP